MIEQQKPARVALITGGARGIGRAIGVSLAARGWSVSICYRTSAEDARSAVQEFENAGGRGLAQQADVSDPANCERLVRTTESELGPIDAFIHCAGPYHRVGLLKETHAGWREMFDANLHSAFYLAQLVSPGMQERNWGRILTFGMAGADRLNAQPFVTAHAIAKAGLLALTRTLAKILAANGVTANTISPGFIDSGSAPSEELAHMATKIPAGRIGELSDAVGAANYLLSDEARYVTGTNLVISGGWGV
ncbi:MAG: 3-oxoacyl-[acyl-carrier protein] reductase [Planctomycetota bacterium]|jgi:3-oxoacyl-[acyl-carrier protein] reductase